SAYPVKKSKSALHIPAVLVTLRQAGSKQPSSADGCCCSSRRVCDLDKHLIPPYSTIIKIVKVCSYEKIHTRYCWFFICCRPACRSLSHGVQLCACSESEAGC